MVFGWEWGVEVVCASYISPPDTIAKCWIRIAGEKYGIQ